MNNNEKKVLYGDRFVTTEDISTIVLVLWAAPCTGGFECILPEGTILVAKRDEMDGISDFNCVPEKYSEFEKRFIPASDRYALKYSGYCFVLNNEEIGVRLQRISRAKPAERRWYDFKEKINAGIRGSTLLQIMVVVLGTVFLFAILPIKPIIDRYRRMKLYAKRKSEESEV